jgi:hypothetical protein
MTPCSSREEPEVATEERKKLAKRVLILNQSSPFSRSSVVGEVRARVMPTATTLRLSGRL